MLSQRFAISVLALALVIPATATTTTYTDATTFNTATQSLFFTQVDFNTATFNSLTGYTDASGATFADSNGLNSLKLSVNSTCFNTCSNGELTDIEQGLSIAVPSNIIAFSFYIASPQGEMVTIAFSGNGAPSSTPFTAPSGGVFFGATTSAPITSFTITGAQFLDTINLDNFEMAPAAQTAEAAPFLLIGTGLVLLRLLGRRWLRLRTS
jgi:hypothetical protein